MQSDNNYQKPITFEKLNEETWGFKFPDIYHNTLYEELCVLEESKITTKQFEKELYRMIKQMPEMFDAVNDLATIYIERQEYGLAKTLLEQSITKARSYIPTSFDSKNDHIYWLCLDNRPFLRMLAAYALFTERQISIEQAIPLYKEILVFNPNDNQGIRILLKNAYLKIKQPEKVIELSIAITDEEIESIDFFCDFILFLKRLQERPIKRTAKGNISLKDIEPLMHAMKTLKPIFDDSRELNFKVNQEEKIIPLHFIKIIAEIMRLTTKKHDKLLLTKKGHDFLEKIPPFEQLKLVFDNYRRKLSWSYYIYGTKKHFELADIFFTYQERIWEILMNHDAEWISYQSFCNEIENSFNIQSLLKESYATPKKILRGRVSSIIFSRILILFNLVEIETTEISQWDTEIARFRLKRIGKALLEE